MTHAAAPFPADGMFGSRAHLYDRIYEWKDYVAESQQIRDVLAAEGVADGARLVDAACGTGEHLKHLRQWYDVSGFDISDDLLALAREKLPDVPFVQGDLGDFTLDRRADVITCLFSAIGCVYPEDRLRASARSFARALAPGGIAVIEPWIEPDAFLVRPGPIQTSKGDDFNVVRTAASRVEGRKTILDLHWLIASPGRVEHFAETHVLWMSTRDELVDAFADAELDARWEHPGPMGRGLVVARKSA